MIPTAKLAIEFQPINPPKPTGIGVLVDGKPIAYVDLDNFKEIASKLAEMEAVRK